MKMTKLQRSNAAHLRMFYLNGKKFEKTNKRVYFNKMNYHFFVKNRQEKDKELLSKAQKRSIFKTYKD